MREHVAQELDIDVDLPQGVYALADLLHSGITLAKQRCHYIRLLHKQDSTLGPIDC